jgi:hypothetical protein
MALRVAGVDASDASIRSALDFLHSIQNDDGGFSFQPGSSDVSSTAWCVQAIVAAGQDPAGAEWSRKGNTPRGFVASMQASDGRFLWMDGADKNPVWTTAYAVCALAGKPYPIGVSYSGSPGGREDTAGEDGAGAQPAPAPADPGQGEEAPDSVGEEEVEEPQALEEEAPQDAGGMENADAEDEEQAPVVARGEDDRNGSSSGSSFLFWLVPLLVAVPLLSLGGWRLYRRYG